MSIAPIVMLALKASIALIVLGIGLGAQPRDLSYLLRHPALFARSFLAMNVIVPAFTLWMARAFDLLRPVKVALIALALSPVPPFLPLKITKAGGTAAYTVGLLGMTSLMSVAIIPASLWVLGTAFDTRFAETPIAIVRLVGTSVLVPLIAGVAIRRWAPAAADRIARPVSIVAMAMLAAGALALVVASSQAIRALIGNGTLVAIIVVTAVALLAGHVLGGPGAGDRTVLALSASSRHPAVAMAIAGAAFPGEKLVPAAVLLDLIVVTLVSMPYTRWARRRAHAPHSPVSSAAVPPPKSEDTRRWHTR